MTEPFTATRTDPPYEADEKSTLEGFLDYHRATLAMKCAGLTAEQLRERAIPPSALSLIGLVRHMTDVEAWFNDDIADGEVTALYSTETNRDGEFDDVAEADPAATDAAWQVAIARSRAFTARTDLAHVCGHSRSGAAISLRWIMVHMVEEYARHNGHADLLRERVDGATGE